MKRFILIPDSFKGTMSSAQICGIMASAITEFLPEASVRSIPVADGGEGTVEAFLSAVGGEKRSLFVTGPRFEKLPSFYGMLADGRTAVVEMAAAAGLPLMGERLDVGGATTFGVGELILDAVQCGARHIILGLGGSATNDGGCGAAAALGAVFRDSEGRAFVPTGSTLGKIASVEVDGIKSLLKGVKLTAMCDIDNPLCGPRGAARIFGPQKGATPEQLPQLDAGLRQLEESVLRCLGIDRACEAGAGAAGGMGYGASALLGAELKMGIDTVLDVVNFDSMLDETDCIFTGEGKIDIQSLSGKVVIGVSRRAKKGGIPVIAIVGDVGDNIEKAYEEGVTAIFPINRVAVPYSEARLRAQRDLRATMEDIMRLLKTFGADGQKESLGTLI